ncbi:MAG TPA: sigma-70 family RNA polymerase sigma factor [Verrucomicrobiae bacterium]|nr:sigma-70 family RNA polymerase sigma factor [Verrucomicrobiae bacterium]
MNTNDQQQRFAEWIHDYSGVLYRVVNGFADGDDRNDLLQEVLLAVWKSIPAFRGQAKASTYLYRVCHNTALLWTRSRKSYRLRLEQLTAFAPTAHSPEGGSLTQERLAALYAEIRRLKPADRSLILLALDGLSYRDMAEVLGLSESNVGVKLNRIKTQLGQTLKDKDYEPR